ncbi:hypothetical protein D9757_012294 [Collybiopsis confluens]|uniref:Integrase catalytic domain-containing protein n=1 Tax=Collybiopsis confluens TaxID=2823264 RepID=A0A8H5G5P2_9AGAR|nr:hypothetical protein D9757_012294 [Collybiopsis confluens]
MKACPIVTILDALFVDGIHNISLHLICARKLGLFPQNSYYVLRDRQLLGLANWATFRDHLKSTARSTGLLGYLDGSIQPVPPIPVAGPVVPGGIPPTVPTLPTPINSRTPSVEEWELRDGRLAGIIYQNIKDPRSIGVTEDMSSNAMWVKLTGEYETTSAAAQALAKERIQQFKYNPGTRFEDYFKQLEALRKAANDVGCSILDEDLRSRFLTSLTANNLWILQTHGARSYSDLKRTLIEYNMMVESTNAVGLETVIPSALAIPGTIVCDNCNRNGHTKKGCWARGGGREGFAPRWYKAPKGMEPSGKTSTSSTVAATSSEDPPVTSAATTVYQFSDDDFNGMSSPSLHVFPPIHPNHRLGLENYPVLSEGGGERDSVVILAVPSVNKDNSVIVPTYLDSAASHWCIRDRRRFINYTPTKALGHMAEEGNKGTFIIEGYGIAKISIRTNEGSINLLRFPAKHVPSFGMNLISIPALDRKGLRGEWGNGMFMVKDPASGRIVVDGQLAGTHIRHGLYRVSVVDQLDSYPLSTSEPSKSPSSTFVLASSSSRSRSKPCSLAMWHTRFGHADVNLIRIMAKRKLVDGLEVTDFELCGKCEPCLYAKAKRLPFDDIVIPSSEPLDRVSLDLWGPSRTKSLGGASYMLLACDDGTGIPFPYFSSNKEGQTVLKLVQDFVEMSERQTERKVKVFRIDMGREFDNKTMDAWCANRGILVEKIPKASSAANGQVERANRTIISGVRSMLEDSDLDNRFWAEGSASYCYIRGMIPTNRHPGKIPWEKWFEASGKKVNVSHLRRWGSKCWVTDLDRVDGKLGRQAWQGRMVGYMGRRGYRVWDPVRKGVYPVRDVICEEGIPRQTSGVVPVSDGPIFDDVDVEAEQPGRTEVETNIPTTEPSAEIKDNPAMIPNDQIPPGPLEPLPPVDIPPMRRSGRIRTASARQLLHLESQDDEIRAREGGEEWANAVVLASTIKGGELC